MARKTVDVLFLIERGNHILSQPDSEYINAEVRRGVIGMLHNILSASDNYAGFSYLASEWDSETNSLKEGYDDTRRRYHIAPNLSK